LEGGGHYFGTYVELGFGQIWWLIVLRSGNSLGVVAGNNWANSAKELKSRLPPTLIAANMNSKSSRRLSSTLPSVESAPDGACAVARLAILHSLRVKCPIPSG